MQAIILAGGFGTRLKTVVSDLPKPMAPINGKPFLAYLLSYLQKQGVNHFILSVHHMADKIQDYFGTKFNGAKITYCHEDQPLGTGGAIKLALSLTNSNQPIIALNGDSFLTFDLSKLVALHHHNNQPITLTLREIEDTSRYGKIEIEGNYATSFAEKQVGGQGFINAGLYLINPDLFGKYDLPEKFSFEQDFLKNYTPIIRPNVMIVPGYFIDIGIPDDYNRACRELPALITDI